MQLTKQQTQQVSQSPLTVEMVESFFSRKKDAKAFLVNFAESREYAIKANRRGESEDTEFELMFWDGRKLLDTDDMFDLGINAESLVDYCQITAYDEALDATHYLCRYGQKPFYAVCWEWKDEEYALSVWWLS